MEDGCLQEKWRDSQHSWLKDVETEKRMTQTGSVLIDFLESRCTEKDGNIGIHKILKVVGRDAAMQPVAKEPNHWMS